MPHTDIDTDPAFRPSFDAGATLAAPSGDMLADLIGRLRLTQGEIRRLLRMSDEPASVVPHRGQGAIRIGSVASALGEALLLVGDDELVSGWLRSPHARRGGATPMAEAEFAQGDAQIRFVLRPDPMELVLMMAERTVSRNRAARADMKTDA